MSGIHHLVPNRQKLKILSADHVLHLLRCAVLADGAFDGRSVGSRDSLAYSRTACVIRWSVTSSGARDHRSEDDASSIVCPDTERRLGDSSRRRTAEELSRVAGVYPIFTSAAEKPRKHDPRGAPSARRRGGGGDEETRTPDPLLAKEMLFQLSYVPLPASLRQSG